MIEWERNDSGECGAMGEVPKGATVLSVDGAECVGMCELCLEPILETEEYNEYAGGVIVHCRCDGEGAPGGEGVPA